MTAIEAASPPVSDAAVHLTGLELPNSLIGGKAAAIDRLIAWGVKVPATAVVTAAAFRVVADRAPVTHLMSRLAIGEDVPAQDVDRAFLDAGLGVDLVAVASELAKQVGSGGMVAVRSSATVEDQGGASFAGQYRSVLHVDSDDLAAVERAVLLVFASLLHPAPRAYRAALGIADSGAAMAAMIMPMIEPVRAGVLFTQDPSDTAGTIRVETVTGQGEQLVSGRRTPSVLHLSRDAVPTAPPELAPLIKAAAEIERRAGVPQDIEWAFDGSTLWIVQARPITVTGDGGDPFDAPPESLANRDLTTTGIVEMLPGVFPPLRWELCSYVTEEGLRAAADRLGVAVSGDDPLLWRVRGRAALDARLVAALAPADGLKSLSRRIHAISARRQATSDAEIVIAAVGRLVDPPLSELTLAELFRNMFALIDLAVRAMAAEIVVSANAGAIYNGLQRVLEKYVTSTQASELAGVLGSPGARISTPATASASVFGGPTWAEQALEPPDASFVASGERVGNAFAVLTSAAGFPEPGVGRWMRLGQVERLAAETGQALRRREETKSAILTIGGAVRRIVLELGSRLVASGVLTDGADIELLTMDEVRLASIDGELVARAEIARRRRWLVGHEGAGPLPPQFRGAPGGNQAMATTEQRKLEGWAASAGTFRGIARRVTSAAGPIGPDEVLVATTTDPSWSPILIKCGAMVIEQGGPLSHAAILAREFGVPAVFNIQGAAKVLDGHEIVVDGTAGTVTLMESENREALR